MYELIIQAGDMGPMTIARLSSGSSESSPLADEDVAISAVDDCLALIRQENPTVVIFKLILTVKGNCKIELYYSLRGEDEISPMGTAEYEYASLAQFKERMHTDFSGLEFPL